MSSSVRSWFSSALLVCAVLSLLGCRHADKAQPAPVTAEGNLIRIAPTNLVFLKWPTGPTLLVWLDIDGQSSGGSGPCPAGVWYAWSHREVITRQELVMRTYPPGVPQPPQPPRPPGPPPMKTTEVETGRGVNWRCESLDGVTGTMIIGTEKFDLAKGNVFLVSTVGGGTVTQLTRDLSGLEPKNESFAGLAKNDEDLRKFVTAAKPSE